MDWRARSTAKRRRRNGRANGEANVPGYGKVNVRVQMRAPGAEVAAEVAEVAEVAEEEEEAEEEEVEAVARFVTSVVASRLTAAGRG